MTTADIEASDIELAVKLLNQHKQAEKQKEADKLLRKKRRREVLLGIKEVYDALGVPHKDQLIITGFELRRKNIGGYSVILNLTDKENPVIHCDYHAGRSNEDRGQSGKEGDIVCRQWQYIKHYDHYNRMVERHHTRWLNHLEKSNRVHTFYENRLHQCPFCGNEQAQPDKHKWEGWSPIKWFDSKRGIREDERGMKPEYLHKTPIKYKRCDGCQGMSHKQYLADHTYRHYIDECKKELYETLYPSPMEHDAQYFLEKRKKKLQSKQQGDLETTIEENHIDCVVEYSHNDAGNVYLMMNNHTGRVKIGMTKNKPEYRERTLQSQEPDIELIFYREVPKMRRTEFSLHQHFADKRVRGEWFDLSVHDIEYAKSLIIESSQESL